MPPSEAIEAAISEKVAKLETFFDGIIGCRVVVEAPHRHHHKGKLYHIRIDLTLPGSEIVVVHEPKRLEAATPRVKETPDVVLGEMHEPGKYAAHEDVYVAIRDAFNAAERQLKSIDKKHRTEPLEFVESEALADVVNDGRQQQTGA